MTPRAKRAVRRLRSIAAALSCLVLVFAFASGLLQANTRYFYCESMGMMREDPCAAAHRAELPPPADELSRTPFTCCSTGVLGALPTSTTADEVSVQPPRLVAILELPCPIEAWRLAIAAASDPARFHRLRIPPRPARELRAKSTIFLT